MPQNYSVQEILELAKANGWKVPEWSTSWARLKVYNGFNHEVRVKKWQALKVCEAQGILPKASKFRCSICGVPPTKANIQFHSENYDSLYEHYSVCNNCHKLIHYRFKAPQLWKSHIAKYSNGKKWFESLSCEPQPQDD